MNRQPSGRFDKITILRRATHTAGFEKSGGYPGLVFAPGTKWSYGDGGPHGLAECIALVYRRDVAELLFERVSTPQGIHRDALIGRCSAYCDAKSDGIARHELGSGIHSNMDAMARISRN